MQSGALVTTLIGVAIVGTALVGCDRTTTTSPTVVANGSPKPSTGGLLIETQIDNFCGACHPTPQPNQFSRSLWRKEVELGYRLYFESDRTGLPVPVMSEVIAFYERRAPAELPPVMSYEATDPSGLVLQAQAVLDGPADQVPAVANIKWVALRENTAPVLLTTDMRSGQILIHEPQHPSNTPRQLAKLNHPCHIEPCDLDGDGKRDFVVADLGSYLPADHADGRVIWLRGRPDTDEFDSFVLADQMGRVADVRPGDFNGDSQPDLVVAEFGWRQTGRLRLLLNQGLHEGIPRFENRIIDPRHGAIHVPIWDANQDGRLDFAAVFSQEHEVVEIFLGDGAGGFRAERIFAGGMPSYGSSGLSLVDLDLDGDQDLLYTNGDMFDDHLLRNYHAVHWLENRGSQGWETHELVSMPAAHCARAADMDGDGDLDVVASAFMPQAVADANPGINLASLLWIEQQSPGKWIPHVLELGSCRYASLEVADFDGDGDPDLAAGNYTTNTTPTSETHTIWWNNRSPSPNPNRP